MLVTIKQLKYHFLAIFFMLSLAFGGIFLLFKPESHAEQADNAVIADLNKQIDEQRAKIDKIVEELEKNKQNLSDARSKASTLQNQVYILTNQIAKTNLDIQIKEEEAKKVQLEIDKLSLELKNNEAEIEKSKIRLGAFIRKINSYDQQSYLMMLLGNDSFAEFFDQVNSLESVGADLQNTLDRVQELVDALNQQKAEVEKKQQELSELLSELSHNQYALSEQKNTKQYLIAETKNSEKRFQGLVDDLKQAQSAANSQVAALEQRLRQELAKDGDNKLSAFGDAALSWPTESHRLTCYFHDPDYPYRNLFEHSGIDLGVPSGTLVRAAESGYVAKVAIGTKWYGNYIMIIHNNNLATLYAHLSATNVNTDQYVTKGQVIGYSGNTGFSSGPHLHFEVRSNGIPVNPLSYLP